MASSKTADSKAIPLNNHQAYFILAPLSWHITGQHSLAVRSVAVQGYPAAEPQPLADPPPAIRVRNKEWAGVVAINQPVAAKAATTGMTKSETSLSTVR